MVDLSKCATEIECTEEARIALGGVDVRSFTIDPQAVYPAMIEEIKAVLTSGKGPAKFLNLEGLADPVVMYYEEAKRLGLEAFKLALVPYESALSMAAEEQKTRNAALECARKWFTELLHQSIGSKPLHVRILAGDKSHKLTK